LSKKVAKNISNLLSQHPIHLSLSSWLLTGAFLLIACQSTAIEPPRLKTQTAVAATAPTTTPEPILSEARTPTAEPPEVGATTEVTSPESSQKISLWVNETSAEHSEALKLMTEEFGRQSGYQVETIQVPPRLLPELVQTAVVSGTLPDLIVHPAVYSLSWADQGILDTELATQVAEELGRDTFDPAALALLATGQGERSVAALPSDGWKQLLIYRADWFDELDLAPPDNYENLMLAAGAIFEPDSIISGLVVPTDNTLVETHQVFEQIALANGCEIVDGNGEVLVLQPACLDALEFYRSLVNDFSPIGIQTNISALNAYLAGRTGIIVSSSHVLPILAGLDETNRPSCPACESDDYLARNSGFITEFEGSGDQASPASFGQLTALGITTVAEEEAAAAFARFWFEEGYPNWLSLRPERKVTLRLATPQEPEEFIAFWREVQLLPEGPTLSDIYGEEQISKISEEIAASNRWGFAQNQGSLIGSLYEDLVLPTILQEMLSGYFNSSQSVIEIYRALVDLLPDYAFPILPTPTPV
jgi:multiple sugar transport system substrate-binding protein